MSNGDSYRLTIGEKPVLWFRQDVRMLAHSYQDIVRHKVKGLGTRPLRFT